MVVSHGQRNPDTCLIPTGLHTPALSFLCPPCNAIHPQTASTGIPRPHWVTPPKNHAGNWPADIPCKEPLIKTWSWAHAVPSAKNTVPCLAHSPSEAFTLERHDYCNDITKAYATQSSLVEGPWGKHVSVLSPRKAVRILGT